MNARSRTVSLALTATLALATAAGCGEDDSRAEDPTPVNGGSSGAADPDPTPEPSDSPGTSEPTDDTDTGLATVPAYLVGDTPHGPRLFREFHRVTADDLLDRAAEVVTAGDPLDPDYRSPFPEGGTLTGVSAEGGELVVELPDASWTQRPAGMTRQQARLAVQALVYTLQGVQQERLPMRTVLDGEPAALLGLDTGAGVREAPPLTVLGLVNVTAPEEGATVSGTFQASGVASSFEATVPWEVRDSSGSVVVEGFSTAEGWMDKLYPWTGEVDVSQLAPGTYTFAAMTDDPSDGEGPGPTEDTKTIVVE